MLKHTKIVATISDQRCDVEFVRSLYNAGMNVVRLNTLHMMEEGLNRVVTNVREVSDRIGILMDTKGRKYVPLRQKSQYLLQPATPLR